MMPVFLRPYFALFMNGARQAMSDRLTIMGSLIIYATLLAIWLHIFKLIPMQDIGIPGITYHHFVWYFALTEAVIVSSPGLAKFGLMIGEGRITEMMQRPISMAGMVMARLMGQQVAMGFVTMVPVAVVLYFVTPISFDVALLPFWFLSFILSAVLCQLFCYLVGMVEIFGPYSRPFSWIFGKFIFSFGGLFFPVMLFPEWLQTIVWMTPFPATIYVPASVVLKQDAVWMLQRIGIQMLWIAILSVVVLIAEHGMLRRVMRVGD